MKDLVKQVKHKLCRNKIKLEKVSFHMIFSELEIVNILATLKHFSSCLPPLFQML